MANNVGERYARAMLEVSEERNETAKIADVLASLAAAIENNNSLVHVMRDPRMKDERVAVFTALAEKLQSPAAVSSLLRTLDDAERLPELGKVATAFVRLADEKAGRVRAHVSSAAELQDADKKAMQATLSDTVGKTVSVDYSVDPTLIGGVVVKVQDLVWDGSLRSELERLRQTLRS